MLGKYIKGSGHAHEVMKSSTRIAHHYKLFKTDMIGTFNIKLRQPWVALKEPHFEDVVDGHKFMYWLCRLTSSNGTNRWAYVLRWSGSKMRQDIIEVISKEKLQKSFTEGDIIVDISYPETKEETLEWLESTERKLRFQGHRFDPLKRSDSIMVWNHFKDFKYEGATVLDIGCNSGFYSFEAAKQGAIVDAVDKSTDFLKVAHHIQEKVYGTDVHFFHTDSYDWQKFDYEYDFIFFLSVYHQLDPTYERLIPTIKHLKTCYTKGLVLELINPPLEGKLTKVDIDVNMEALGGKKVLHYKHKVRRTRSLYLFT